MDYIESIGANVRRARFIKGLSQLELSRLTGLSPGHISEIENGGRKNIQAKTIKRLAHGLDVDIATLLDEGRMGEGK